MTNNKKGFTLIELLVVIAIIGILSAIGLVSLNGAREKARDAKRQSDLAQIRSAMALYYDDQNPVGYLASSSPSPAQADPVTNPPYSAAQITLNGTFATAMDPYLPNLPQTPTTITATTLDNGYWYVASATQFGLATKLEGGLKDWYVLNSIGYGGTKVDPVNRALAYSALACAGADAGAGSFELCIATPN